ncbi:MAG: antibiotic biosynthesis monooxygenase [Thermodesulfobacteriota bacterium]|jgi:quinol monooxygenase YgiN
MYTRLFYGTIQPGKAEEAWQVLHDFAQRVKQQPGCVLNQVLQNDNEIVGITTWKTKEALAAYADGELARELFTRITPLFMGRPTVRTYEVKLNLVDQEAVEPVG